MKPVTRFPGSHLPGLAILALSLLLINAGCQKGHDTPDSPIDALSTDSHGHGSGDNDGAYIQVNLVANNSNYGAAHIDATLINAWGIAFSSTGTPWVSSQSGHVSDVYTRDGVVALPAVNIPSPGGQEGGNPTGAVFNASTTDFVIPAGNGTTDAASRFIFCGVDGMITAWNGTWGNHAYSKLNNSATSSYTGLALAANAGANYLYAADFRARRIAVWDKNWNPVQMLFNDWRLPRGYAPFNIQAIGEYLYVTYARVGRDGRSEVGEGKGFVNIFRTNGTLVKRFAGHDQLNAPWGITMAPATFFPADDDGDDDHGHHWYDRHGHDNDEDPQPAILIGNFGDGHINVYNLRGDFRGQLKTSDRNKSTLVIKGLWALTFPPATSTIDPNRLYFAAGPKKETDGLFGYIVRDSTKTSSSGNHHGHD